MRMAARKTRFLESTPFCCMRGSGSQKKEKRWLAFDLASTNGTLHLAFESDGKHVELSVSARAITLMRERSFGSACADDELLCVRAARRAGAAIQMHGACNCAW